MKQVDIGIKSSREYWELVVQPNEKAFFDTQSHQTTINLSLSLWHLGDWVSNENFPAHDKKLRKYNLQKFNKSMIESCPLFSIVRDIIDTGKHRILDRSTVNVSSVPQVASGAWGTSAWGTTKREFYVQTDDGELIALRSVFGAASAYWRQHFEGTAEDETEAT
ncbi:hypothetical protein [Azospirillum argentinense]|uniref:hypothetical protein n=1 Tax=Azospirillum argentinense TaxID=2970906 RepID=UPI0010BFB642|nr:hypothetical protein [Azospirillum argentinense]